MSVNILLLSTNNFSFLCSEGDREDVLNRNLDEQHLALSDHEADLENRGKLSESLIFLFCILFTFPLTFH